MTSLFKAASQIRSAVNSNISHHAKWAERNWIRLVIPISVRTISDRKLPCANKASLVQVERTFEQVTNADAAAQNIDREMRIIMGFKLDRVFLIAIRMLNLFPPFLRFAARNQKSRGTAVFTHLGEPFRKTRACNFRNVGDLELIDYDLCGPIRRGTPINFSFSNFRHTVDDKLKLHGRISLHYDRRLLTYDTAQSILQAFVQELTNVAQFGGSQA